MTGRENEVGSVIRTHFTPRISDAGVGRRGEAIEACFCALIEPNPKPDDCLRRKLKVGMSVK